MNKSPFVYILIDSLDANSPPTISWQRLSVGRQPRTSSRSLVYCIRRNTLMQALFLFIYQLFWLFFASSATVWNMPLGSVLESGFNIYHHYFLFIFLFFSSISNAVFKKKMTVPLIKKQSSLKLYFSIAFLRYIFFVTKYAITKSK